MENKNVEINEIVNEVIEKNESKKGNPLGILAGIVIVILIGCCGYLGYTTLKLNDAKTPECKECKCDKQTNCVTGVVDKNIDNNKKDETKCDNNVISRKVAEIESEVNAEYPFELIDKDSVYSNLKCYMETMDEDVYLDDMFDYYTRNKSELVYVYVKDNYLTNHEEVKKIESEIKAKNKFMLFFMSNYAKGDKNYVIGLAESSLGGSGEMKKIEKGNKVYDGGETVIVKYAVFDFETNTLSLVDEY